MIEEYSFRQLKSMHIMMTECQKEIERAFDILSEQYELPHPLLFSHNWILQCLYHAKEPMSLTSISHASDIALPNVSVGVQALIDNGMVEQSNQVKNKRIRAIQMTPLGRKICDDYLVNHVSRIKAKIYAGISDELSGHADEYFDLVVANVEKMRAARREGKTGCG